jgi:conflict system pore-forming effector with SLATT domain
MFELSLLDHLRLTFGHVIYRQKAHAQTAHAHARWSRALRVGEALLMGGAAVTSFGMVFGRGPGYAVATAVLTSSALAFLLIHLLFDFDRSADAHRVCSAKLWHIREQYRALMADLRDGAIDITGARHWRDGLMRDLHHIYENAPPADRQMYEAAKKVLAATDEAALTDEEIDRFLPQSLQKPGKPAAA